MYKNSDMEDGNKQKANKGEQTPAIPETRNKYVRCIKLIKWYKSKKNNLGRILIYPSNLIKKNVNKSSDQNM